MRRKKSVFIACILVLLSGYAIGIVAQSPEQSLTQTQIDAPNDIENQTELAQRVLDATGRNTQYDLQDLEDITIYFGGDVTGTTEDVVVTLNFGPKNTVVAAYTADGDVYEYTGDLGDFYRIQNIRFIPIEELGKDIVIVREQVNESLGSFQKTDILRAYVYDGTEFRDILNTTQKIESTWNDIWNQSDILEESLWRRVTEETENSWLNTDELSFTVTRYQSYLESTDHNEQEVPQSDTFEEKDSRVVVEKFFWSEKWERFILFEAIETATEEEIAIIENLTASPYGLAGFIDTETYQILREDGTTAYVTAEQLQNITTPNVTK